MGTVMSITSRDAGDALNAKGVDLVRQNVSRQKPLVGAYVACAVRGGYCTRPEDCISGSSIVLPDGLAIETAFYLLALATLIKPRTRLLGRNADLAFTFVRLNTAALSHYFIL
jgi:hypothetical protein